MGKRMACLVFALALAGCATMHHGGSGPLRIPYLDAKAAVDGKLDEACYRKCAHVTTFSVAGDPARKTPATEAWLFWNGDGLTCAFKCADATPAWAAPDKGEQDVDGQDRCEVFLWDGNPSHEYHCIEAAPGGALHDYEARFYRHFDNDWSPSGGWTWSAARSPQWYTVEMFLPKAAIEAMGLRLEKGAQFRLGLFRADYDTYNGEATWITWIDYGGKPDFHIAESFGTAVLAR
jgi:hypothetical protein